MTMPPRGLDDLMPTNYATHKHPKVRARLKSSCASRASDKLVIVANLVERFFADYGRRDRAAALPQSTNWCVTSRPSFPTTLIRNPTSGRHRADILAKIGRARAVIKTVALA